MRPRPLWGRSKCQENQLQCRRYQQPERRRYTPDANNKCTKLLKVKTTSALDSRTKISPSNVSAPLLPGKLVRLAKSCLSPSTRQWLNSQDPKVKRKDNFFLGFLPLVPFLFCTSFIDTSMLCWLVTPLPFHQIPDFSALRLVWLVWSFDIRI